MVIVHQAAIRVERGTSSRQHAFISAVSPLSIALIIQKKKLFEMGPSFVGYKPPPNAPNAPE
jgi:hypothetical protein